MISRRPTARELQPALQAQHRPGRHAAALDLARGLGWRQASRAGLVPSEPNVPVPRQPWVGLLSAPWAYWTFLCGGFRMVR